MREHDRTTRQRIASTLRTEPKSPSALASAVDAPRSEVFTHIEHLARSLAETDDRLLVAPPTCRACGFDDFDDPINDPSRCPECRNESIAEPEFVIE